MLKIGIVGKNYSKLYTSIIYSLDFYELTGIFDPSYQFDYPKNINRDLVFISFENLIKKSDAIVFASPEKIYLPLIETALKYSKPVFLHSVQNLSYSEQIGLKKLHEEASEVLQIYNSVLFHDAFIRIRELIDRPQFIQYVYCDNTEKKILHITRSITGAVLSLFKTNYKKITANTISVYNEVPDIIKVRIDFDNGSIAEIMVNNIENQKTNNLKCFEYNGFFNIDFDKNKFSGLKNENEVFITAKPVNNNPNSLLRKQLVDFYNNVSNYRNPTNSIENEIITQEIIEKIKEKIRISLNIF